MPEITDDGEMIYNWEICKIINENEIDEIINFFKKYNIDPITLNIIECEFGRLNGKLIYVNSLDKINIKTTKCKDEDWQIIKNNILLYIETNNKINKILKENIGKNLWDKYLKLYDNYDINIIKFQMELINIYEFLELILDVKLKPEYEDLENEEYIIYIYMKNF